jgi:hypothetical protein
MEKNPSEACRAVDVPFVLDSEKVGPLPPLLYEPGCLPSLQLLWRRPATWPQMPPVAMQVMLYAVVDGGRVEEADSVGDNMDEVAACDLRVD